MDLAWMPDGLGLFVCAFDGTVLSCRFSEEELGESEGLEREGVKGNTQLHTDYGVRCEVTKQGLPKMHVWCPCRLHMEYAWSHGS